MVQIPPQKNRYLPTYRHDYHDHHHHHYHCHCCDVCNSQSGERVGRWNPRARLVSCSLLPSQVFNFKHHHHHLPHHQHPKHSIDITTIDIIIKITFDTPQAGRWTPTHKELETSDWQQGRISSAATHIPSKQRSYLFCQQMAFKKVVVLCI